MEKTTQSDKQLKIYMLGRFALEYDGKIMIENQGKIHKVWTLLGYLLANHDRKLGAQELPEILCGDDRSSEPVKAVKNLVYRLRCVLAESGLPKENYVIQTGGIYSWNNDLDCVIDTDEFIEAYNKARKVFYDSDKAIEFYFQAISIYKGKFLPHAAYDEWAVNATTYYHRLFIDSVICLYQLLEKKESYEPMVEICEKAINIDAYNEDIYKIYIHCLTKIGRHKEALAAYETITTRLYDELGVNPSKELRSLYRDIIKTLKSVETDLVAIKEDLNEGGHAECSYFCEYQIFKDIYRFIARRVNRTGESIYIMLCTLTDNQDEIPSTEYLAEAMDTLKTSIGKTLRKCDLFSRYSNSQFVVMLPDISYENGCMVAGRIENVYKKNKVSKVVVMHYKLQPLDPKLF
ncbi:BTAD domain-containing putative transcriptional regulator [Aminipila sp.]|uniref:BTAD domain-containing putative transcriptional regulator n=1 Tax=Aminipila sp. TaxID=2060095 RepID=UPI0028979637|nr:BTAD domain-containing putative transcriptional regulator [Aminipila sp.]